MSTFHGIISNPGNTNDGVIYHIDSSVPYLDNNYQSAPWALNLDIDDLSGPGADDRLSPDFQRNLANEDDYISVDVELRALDAWHDKATDRCTVTLEQHQARPDVTEARFYKGTHKVDALNEKGEKIKIDVPNKHYTFVPDSIYVEPEMRQAFIEGNDAFFSLKVLDHELTKKYHARLLNWFLDRNTAEVRVGSMRFGINDNGERYVQCVRSCTKDANGNWYKPGALIDSFSHSREAMETFIYSVIKHGNNCAASFIKNRPDWYAMHSVGCDLKHNTNAPCNGNAPVPVTHPEGPEDFNEVEFLFDHQQYCKDARCKCEERLAELVPSLVTTKESA